MEGATARPVGIGAPRPRPRLSPTPPPTHDPRPAPAPDSPPTSPRHAPAPQEHQQCVTIKTRFRPVPLHWHFCYKGAGGATVADLLAPVRAEGTG